MPIVQTKYVERAYPAQFFECADPPELSQSTKSEALALDLLAVGRAYLDCKDRLDRLGDELPILNPADAEVSQLSGQANTHQ